MPCKVLQRLLSSGEYNELEDVVIAEGEFVETDAQHNAVRQVILGMTPINLIVAERHITNYKDHPEVYYLTEVDPYMDGLEVSSVLPVCLIRMEKSYFRYELTKRVYDKTRYYELSNTRLNGDLEDTWGRWIERVLYLKEDPYGYVRSQFDTYNIPYPEYYVCHKKSRDQEIDLLWKLLDLGDIEMFEKDTSEVDKKISEKMKKDKTTPDKKRHKKNKKWKWFKKDKK